MKKFYGILPMFPYKKDFRLSFRMPEVPLTKSCLEDYSLYSEATASTDIDESLRAMNEQKKAVKDLSLWYMSHLSAMYAIQRYKNFHSKSDLISKQVNFDFDNYAKLKNEPLSPYVDLENYSNSLKSRQKELHNFGKRGKVWEKYFKNAIPGWEELRQGKKILPNLPLKASRENSAGQNVKLTDHVEGEISLDNRKDLEPSQTGGQSTLPPLQLLLRAADGQGDSAASFGNVKLEGEVRDYFMNSANVRTEQMGNINNEILFNQVYGKYLPGGGLQPNKIKKRRKRKPTPSLSIIPDVLDVLPLDKPEEDDLDERSIYLRQIEELKKLKENEWEQMLLYAENKKKAETEYNKSRRRRGRGNKRNLYKLQLNSKNKDPKLHQSTHSLIKLAQILKNGTPQKNDQSQLQKNPKSSMQDDPQKRDQSNTKQPESKKTSVAESTSSKRNSRKLSENQESENKENKFFSKKKEPPRNKFELRNRLIEVVNSVWTSDKKLGGLTTLPGYYNLVKNLKNNPEPLQ